MIESRKPIAAFDFNAAAGGVFMTSGGRDFALRLWFWMSAALSIVFIITLPFMLRHYGEFLEASWLQNQATFGKGEDPDPAIFLQAYAKVIPGMLAFTLGLWIVAAMGETAFYKKYFHDIEAPRQPLRFGRMESRTMLIQLGVWALLFGMYILALFALMIIAGIFSVISPVLMFIIMAIGFVVILVLWIKFSIRLAPAAALTVARDQRHVLAANKITKFRFWNLFVAYLVTYIGGYIGYYLLYTLSIMVATGDPDFMVAISGFGSENPRILFDAAAERFKNPLFMALGILAMILNAAAMVGWMLLVAGVNAYAIKWWAEDNPVPNFE